MHLLHSHPAHTCMLAQVEADPMRVLLPTEASSAVDDKVQGAFKMVNGYTVEQVYRDERFKVCMRE